MKLRNKKTGEVFNFTIKSNQDNTVSYFLLRTGSGGWEDGLGYYTLTELNEEWEDYKPAEPLIKDEKIRKAVRAWAEAESEDCFYGKDATTLHNGSGDNIEFWSRPFKDLEVGEHYTIAELCGEEEE